MSQLAKLGPHRYAEVDRTGDGVVVRREFPCIRAVLYDVATGQVLAAHHACFQHSVHVAGAPSPFAEEPGQATLVVDAFPVPPRRAEVRGLFMRPDGFMEEQVHPDVDEDDTAAVVSSCVVDLQTRELRRRP